MYFWCYVIHFTYMFAAHINFALVCNFSLIHVHVIYDWIILHYISTVCTIYSANLCGFTLLKYSIPKLIQSFTLYQCILLHGCGWYLKYTSLYKGSNGAVFLLAIWTNYLEKTNWYYSYILFIRIESSVTITITISDSEVIKVEFISKKLLNVLTHSSKCPLSRDIFLRVSQTFDNIIGNIWKWHCYYSRLC